MKIDFKYLPETFSFSLPPGVAYHIQVTSYTINEVVHGVFTERHEDLGVHSHGSINLLELSQALSAVTVPDNTPDFRLQVLNNVGHSQDIFQLEIELVAQPPAHGHHGHWR